MSPKTYYTFMIDPELLAALKRAKAVDPDLSEGGIVRKALREYLERVDTGKAARKRAVTRKRA
jgi:hypothetical protein